MTAASVLVVDDDPRKRLALCSVLAPLGYTVVEAESGVDALRRITERDFAVILLDVRMPIMNGFETAELIRRRRQSEMTPIVFITAYSRDEVSDVNHYAQGAIDFLCGPVVPEELRAKVSALVNLFVKADELAAQARLVQESADQLRLLTDAAPIGIFRTDAQSRYVYTNPRWSELTGIRAEDALGRPRPSVAPSPRDAADGEADPDDGERDGFERSQRISLTPAGFAPRVVVATSRVITDGAGGVAGHVGTLADVTAEHEAEVALAGARDEANEASRLKSDFLANMSHEIRTPMNGVIGMTDLLLRTELDPVQRDYAETVWSSANALLGIIGDILDFSKIEAGKMEIEAVAFSPREVVADVLKLLRASAQAKVLRLVEEVDASVPLVVVGDPGRVRQVLTNLVGNAVKFTRDGDVAVRLTADAVADGDTVLRFEVADTGVGIAEDKVATVFLPFVQADSSTSRKYGGTGLGLAISSQLVSLMSGACGVTSQVGVGSAFWFTVRVRPAVAAPTRGPAEHVVDGTRSAASAGAGRRLLLAEDNVVNQKVAVAMLSSAGYAVDVVANGIAAVEALGAAAYDLVLMDCQMPELNGYEATSRIRALESGHRTPILAMTAGARHEDQDRCLAAGMDDYIAKPVSSDALLALVAQWISAPAAPVTPTTAP